MSLRPRVSGNSEAINFRDGIVIGPQVEAMRSEIENLKTHSQLREMAHERGVSESTIASKLDRLETMVTNRDEKLALEKRLMALEAKFDNHRCGSRVDEAALHARLDPVEKALKAKIREVQELHTKAQLKLQSKMDAEHEAHLHSRLDRIEAALTEKRAAQLAAQLPTRSDVKDLALEKLAHLEAKMTQLLESRKPEAAAPPLAAHVSVDAWVNERMRLDKLQRKFKTLP